MKTLLLAIGVLFFSAAAVAAPKRVLMMVPEGFYAPEYFEPRRIYEAEGFSVTVAAKYPSPVLPDRRQQKDYPPVTPDLTFDKVKAADYDAVTFTGGNGAWEDFFPNDDVHRILAESLEAGKVTALLCSSTGLLGVARNFDGKGAPLARGRKVTGYYRVEGLLTRLGQVAYDPGEPGKPFVRVDGNLVTGRDPLSSEAFGRAVVRALR